MSGFTDILLLSPLADGKPWVIQHPFGSYPGVEGSSDRIEVPVGLRTDFATVAPAPASSSTPIVASRTRPRPSEAASHSWDSSRA